MKRQVIATDIVADDDYDAYNYEDEYDDDEDYEKYDTRTPEDIFFEYIDEFLPYEQEVLHELGLYLDTSSVRGDYGSVYIYSDPEGENDVDMWMGDPDALLAKVEWQYYLLAVARDVLSKDESEWEDAYKTLMTEMIEE